MKNISTGFGLCVLGLGIAAWPVLDRLAPSANASAVTAAASAVSTAATAQTEPTIVWYGVSPPYTTSSAQYMGAMFRAWSDGRVEYKPYFTNSPYTSSACDLYLGAPPGCGWRLFSDPAQGLTFNADLNFDEAVDGADLGELLAKWGPAPRNPVPPSDCPLALINP
jgi:hypothetical protein